MSTKEAECMGLLKAIQWCIDLGFNNVCFEVDAALVVNGLVRHQVDFSEFRLLLHECSSLIDSRSNFSINHVKRQANGCAHSLARAALNYAWSHIFSQPPLFLEESLSFDFY